MNKQITRLTPFVGFALGAVLAASCGGGLSEPTYSLQIVMLEVDSSRKTLEAALSTDAGGPAIASAAATMQTWLENSAVDRFLGSGNMLGTLAQYRASESKLDASLARVLAAADGGDVKAAREAYPAVIADCNACHAVFRPDLPPL